MKIAQIPGLRARLAAFSLYDFGDSGFATTIVTVLFSQYYAGVAAGGAEGVRLFGRAVPGATLYAWLVSLSMALVALAAPFLGATADRGGSRLRMLVLFWFPGTLLTVALSAVGPGDWLFGGVVFVLAYGCFAAASVFYNALLPEVAPPERMGRASGIAWGVGYLGGALLLVLNLLMLKSPRLLGFPEGTFNIRHCFASAGIWWFLFALPLFAVFRYEGRRRARPAGSASLGAEARAVVAQVARTLRSVLRTRNLLLFFLAYLLYNDGVQTVVTMASIFGAEELGMTPEQLILFFLLIQVTAFAGSIVLGWLADRVGHKPTLLLSVVAWSGFTLWAAVLGILGNAEREYWILGGTAGLFLGGIQSCSRSLVTSWIPARHEAEFMGFFAIMSRVASIFGPLAYGTLVLATGSLRRAILSTTLFFVAGGVLLLAVRTQAVEEEREALGAQPAAIT